MTVIGVPLTPFEYETQLTAEMVPPDRIIEEIPVIKTVKVEDAYQISLEKNFTGFMEIALKGQPNGLAVIKIKRRPERR